MKRKPTITIPIKSFVQSHTGLLNLLMLLSQKELANAAKAIGVPVRKYKYDTAWKIAAKVLENPHTVTITIDK